MILVGNDELVTSLRMSKMALSVYMSDGYINWDGRDDKKSSVSVQNNNDSVVLTLLEVWRFFKCIYLVAAHVRTLECLCHM